MKLVFIYYAHNGYIIYKLKLNTVILFISLTLEHSKNPSLSAFDQYYHLLMLVNPKRLKYKLVSQGFFPNGDPFADEAKYLPNDTKMQYILKDVRSCIACNGDEMFDIFVAVLLSDSMYTDLGGKLLGKHVAVCTLLMQLLYT